MTSFRALPAAGLLAAGLLLAGCGGGAWPTGAGSVPPPVTPAPAPGGADGVAGQSGGGSGGAGGGAGNGGAGTGGGTGRCTSASLEAGLGRTTGEAGQRHTVVVWTNSSSEPCTMTGFGGADLRGPDDPRFGSTYSLPRSAQNASPVRLAPGGRAHTVITWLPGGDWTPNQLVVTPPDETSSTTLSWPGAAVSRQDGATRPGTYIGPVTAGAE